MQPFPFLLMLVLLALISSMFTSCHRSGDGKEAWYTDSEALQRAYLAAVEDARMAKPEEICRTLPAIISPNALDDPRQDWKSDRVLVGSMMSAADAARFPGIDYMPWVTLPYDLTDHLLRRLPQCTDSVECRMRLIQLLGLPPDCDYGYLTFFYADADSLFRPCPDTEITDHEAELDFPSGTPSAYREWFQANARASYDSTEPYPWTRLGYTYDWHPGTESIVGPGEFIVRLGGQMQVVRRVGVWTWYREVVQDSRKQ